jgi:drug/metabolite transporter (DMT)-like permease
MRGIVLRLAAIAGFMLMSVMIKACDDLPPGELVFFRSAAALLPLFAFLAWRRELGQAFQTSNLRGHLIRASVGVLGIGSGFYALTKLPLPEVTTINYASPLIAVALGALVLRERVDRGRWLAIGIGLTGVLITAWPRLSMATSGRGLDVDQSIGALVALGGALIAAIVTLLVRTLTRTERSSTIVLYLSLLSSVYSLATIVFGWVMPTPGQWVLLIGAGILGGIAQALFTEALRHAEVSTLAPLEYTSVVLAIGFGYFVFGDAPTPYMLVGGALVIAAGLYIVLRARRRR